MLTIRQKHTLIEIIVEEFGSDLDQEEFIDCCLLMFEDIAGFECLDDAVAQSITEQLWRQYDERHNHPEEP
jgi:hypothetical protein